MVQGKAFLPLLLLYLTPVVLSGKTGIEYFLSIGSHRKEGGTMVITAKKNSASVSGRELDKIVLEKLGLATDFGLTSKELLAILTTSDYSPLADTIQQCLHRLSIRGQACRRRMSKCSFRYYLPEFASPVGEGGLAQNRKLFVNQANGRDKIILLTVEHWSDMLYWLLDEMVSDFNPKVSAEDVVVRLVRSQGIIGCWRLSTGTTYSQALEAINEGFNLVYDLNPDVVKEGGNYWIEP